MRFDVAGLERGGELDIEPDAVIIAGYTGRDRAKVQHHIDELAAIGVPPPASFPAYWLQPPWLATSSSTVVVTGATTSGEAELALVGDGDDLYVTLASDHTDRAAEAIDIELSKAICPVPVASEAWPIADVDGHWDDLVLRSWIVELGGSDDPDDDPDDEEVLYQDDVCSSLVPPLDLLAGLPHARPHRFVMLTGTVPVRGDIRPARRFRAELHDPRHDRSIHLAYDIESLSRLTHPARRTAP
jgi:hypothetical protein